MNTLKGVMLAGGKSSRFGSPKAFAEFGGQYMYRYSLQALQDVADEVLISSAPDLTRGFLDREQVKVIEDVLPFKGKGPMAGIYSCMLAAESDWYIVLPCDMPLIYGEVLKKMLDKRKDSIEAIVVNAYGRTQPLVAVYSSRIISTLQKFLLGDNLRMMELLARLEVWYVDEKALNIEENIFRNVNTEVDFAYLRE